MSNFTDAFPGGKTAQRYDDEAFAGFRQGWAKVAFCGNAPHWFMDVTENARKAFPDAPEDVRWLISLCGFRAVTNDRNGLFRPGNYPLCKRCMKKAPRWATREERDTTVSAEVLRVLKSAAYGR